MSSRSPQSRRTYAGSRSWSLDHHQRPMHVLRSRFHGSVPFDPASPLGKERMVRAVPRDRAGSLAATIADFCNKIGTKRKLGDVRLESAKWAFGSRAARWRAERQKRRSSTKKDAPAGEGDVPGL